MIGGSSSRSRFRARALGMGLLHRARSALPMIAVMEQLQSWAVPATGCTGRSFPAALFYGSGRFLGKQPAAYMFGDRLQTFVADSLAVHRCHIIAGVAHDVINDHLILGLAADCLEGVAQSIKVPFSIDPKCV